MTTIIGRLVRRIEHWLDLLIIPDDRFACGGCDDRFVSRSLGVEHVQRCHPEYRGVMVYEESVGDPVASLA
jgi:hypothetical protein